MERPIEIAREGGESARQRVSSIHPLRSPKVSRKGGASQSTRDTPPRVARSKSSRKGSQEALPNVPSSAALPPAKSSRKGRTKVILQEPTTSLLPSSETSAGQSLTDIRAPHASSEGEVHVHSDDQRLRDLVLGLRELQAQRRYLIKMQRKISNAMGGLVRRALGWQLDLPEKERAGLNKRAAELIAAFEKGDIRPELAGLAALLLQTLAGRAPFDKLRDEVERDMKKMAKQLPVWSSWAKDVRGLGEKSLAIIVGEAGDLNSYDNPAKLWKRMGLAVLNGRRQGSPESNTKETWIEHGYNKERRSASWNIADRLILADMRWMNKETGEVKKEAGPYGELYHAKKAEYMVRVAATEELDKGHVDKWTPLRAERAARRYAEKRLLRDLWRAWRHAPERNEDAKSDRSEKAQLVGVHREGEQAA
jgi:hypothetical protein